ncbi:MAG: pyruvate kinase [Cyanobacteria bacterium HKST-UBA06]|nr:pyruvate kinase [Cyanobacteria bacterium HKST-UBA04]MCA9806880.1 pyruvate kinase [Cyanobacteria bacterium HKST-UBA06]MCA9841380.1 pyruvate kinase [Cyanobacteria bacterium HKST-UBA03]
MPSMRLSKIVATLGPVSDNPDTIKALINAGVNVFRLNFSHGNPEKFKVLVDCIDTIRKELDVPVAILGDIQGPKFRVGTFEGGEPVHLQKGATLKLVVGEGPGHAGLLTTKFIELVSALNVGQAVLLDDGAMQLEVTKRLGPAEVECKVLQGGLLKEKKGINVPGLKIDIEPLTEKDKEDCRFVMTQCFDFLALSFVQSDEDIRYLRCYLAEHNPEDRLLPAIIAKIENPQSLTCIEAIVEEADGIMVARGDMGVEMDLERVPFVQKQLIDMANLAEKPVITATQMLESMITSATPTRAEVSDIANAICDGSDALMLSAETAAGQFPIETVKTMSRIMLEAERNLPFWHRPDDVERVFRDPRMVAYRDGMEFHEAIAQTAVIAARRSDARAIMVMSNSGSMAGRVSKRKPRCPVVVLTNSQHTYYRTNLFWGTFPIKVRFEGESSDEVIAQAENEVSRAGFLSNHDTVVFCAGQTQLLGLTNVLKIHRFDQVIRPGRHVQGVTSAVHTDFLSTC